MARILIDFVESDKKMIKSLQYFANPLIFGLKSFKTHLYALPHKVHLQVPSFETWIGREIKEWADWQTRH